MPCVIVERMAVLDEDFGTDLTLVEGNGGVGSCPVSVPGPTPRDLRSLYERERARADRERARADAAEARAEELRWAEVASRSDAGAWKSRFKACRGRLSEAVEETKEARRAARDVPSLQAEVARLETLLSEAGIGSNESSKIEALRKEVARLRKALTVPEAREGAVGPRPAETRRRHTALEQSPDQKDTIRTLRKDITRLNNEVVRRDKRILQLNKRLDREKQSTETIRETARKLSSESLRLHREVRILGDSEARARSLSDEVFWLRHALEVSKAGKEKLKARLVKLRAAGGDAVEAAVRRGLSTARRRCGDRGARRRRSRRGARRTPGCTGPCGSWRPGKRRWSVVKHAPLTPRNSARSMVCRADRHRTRAPINNDRAGSGRAPSAVVGGILPCVDLSEAVGVRAWAEVEAVSVRHRLEVSGDSHAMCLPRSELFDGARRRGGRPPPTERQSLDPDVLPQGGGRRESPTATSQWRERIG